MMARWFAWAATRGAYLPTARQMSTRDHVGWWTAIVACFILREVLFAQLGDSWPGESVRGLPWLVIALYWAFRQTPDGEPVRRTARGLAGLLVAFVLFTIGFGYVASR